MESSYFLGDDFTEQVVAAIVHAREQTLKAGVPVFYRDAESNIEIMEHPDGRKFKIVFIDGAPRDSNYRVVRELGQTAA